VAERAGIGVDWYIRLEQGRTVSPSVTTIDALARALRLGKEDHAHLRTLARHLAKPTFVRETVPDALRRLLSNLTQPAYITGRRWDILAWNDAAADVFGDFGRMPEPDRNILLHMFTEPNARKLFGATWSQEARRMLAQFRPTYDLWAGDAEFGRLVEQLRRGSKEFDAWWDAHDIRAGAAGRKTLNHPAKATLFVEYATFQSNDDPALKLVIYTPV
jgi:transcriptional regulator with XRE-family HTH domain